MWCHLDNIVTNICQQVARGLAKWTATEYSTFVHIRTSVVCKCIEVINILLEATRRQLEPHSCQRLHRLDYTSDLNKRHISHVICTFTISKADQWIVFVLSIHREPSNVWSSIFQCCTNISGIVSCIINVKISFIPHVRILNHNVQYSVLGWNNEHKTISQHSTKFRIEK